MALIVIIGVGNPLRSDDGVGWRVASELQQELSGEDRKSIHVVAAHQLTPEISEHASRAERVLFVDAAHEGKAGGIRLRRVVPATQLHGRSHDLTPAAIMKLAEELYGHSPPAFLLTVTGESFSASEELSACVASIVPKLKASIRRFIERNPEVEGGSVGDLIDDTAFGVD